MNKILYIKTKYKNRFYIAIYKNKKIYSKNYKVATGEMSKIILKEIIKYLKKHKLTIKDINAFSVYAGPGSYTSLRVGILTANTLAWALNKPIYSLKNDQKIKKNIKKIQNKLNIQKTYNKPVNAYYQQAI